MFTVAETPAFLLLIVTVAVRSCSLVFALTVNVTIEVLAARVLELLDCFIQSHPGGIVTTKSTLLSTLTEAEPPSVGTSISVLSTVNEGVRAF